MATTNMAAELGPHCDGRRQRGGGAAEAVRCAPRRSHLHESLSLLLTLVGSSVVGSDDDERMAAPGGPADISPPRPPAGKGQKKTKESVVAGPGSGKVLYANFLKEFKGDDQSWTIPEFLKPKALRRSQTGHPWSWTVQG